MREKVTVLGAGAFGTSMATLLADNGYKVDLWCYESEVVAQIKQYHENKHYFPGVKLNLSINATSDLQQALNGSKWVFEAIPVKFMRNIFNLAKDFILEDQIVVCLSKGIEQETLLFPSDIVKQTVTTKVKTVVMAGPNFANEIAQKCYTGTVVACDDKKIAYDVTQLLENSYFKIYLTDDIVGVQVCSALKNVLTLAVGIVNDSANTSAFILTNGLQDMAHLVKFLGGQENTVYGLSGLGDLVMSATSPLGRNLKAGKLLRQGKSLDQIKTEMGVLPEGINSVQSIYQLIKKHNLNLPICMATYQSIFERKSFKEFLTKF